MEKTLGSYPTCTFAEMQTSIVFLNQYALEIDILTGFLPSKKAAQKKYAESFRFEAQFWVEEWDKIFRLLGVVELPIADMVDAIQQALETGLLEASHLPPLRHPMTVISFASFNDDGGICHPLEFIKKLDFSFKDLFKCLNPLTPVAVDPSVPFKYNLKRVNGTETIVAKQYNVKVA